jgi:integrase/recombinase XerD
MNGNKGTFQLPHIQYAHMETLNSAVEWFMSHCADHRKLSPHTLKAYRHDLKIFGEFMIKGKERTESISGVTKHSVQHWLASMQSVKPRTIRRRLATVKSMFSSLERQGHVATDPLGRFRSEIKIGNSLPKTIARSTIRALLRAPRKQSIPDSPQAARLAQETTLLEMLFSTGMRVCEVSGLQVEQVDLDRQIVSVRGKGNREREIPIVSEALEEALLNQIKWRCLNGGTSDAPLFVSRRSIILWPQASYASKIVGTDA